MRVLIAIPARFASQRYPGKPLVLLKGATGQARSLVQRSWEAAQQVAGVAQVVVSTDDDRIADAAAGFGADVVMTSATCRNGTERCAETLERLKPDFDLVVNLQGDAPLTPPWFIEALIKEMVADQSVMVATPVLNTSPEMCQALREDRRSGRVGATTAVFDLDRDALYFSKEVVPFSDDGAQVFHHVGVYAYRPQALRRYINLQPGKLELAEGLEQLRFVENKIPVRCVEVDDRGQPFWELNNPEDVPKIEAMMARMGME